MVALKIDMPKNCNDCPCAYWTEGCFHDYCQAAGYNTELAPDLDTRPDWCPLIPVPQHGRLIDADAALKLLRNLGSRDYRREKGTIMDAMKMLSFDEYTPTIIPAEEE